MKKLSLLFLLLAWVLTASAGDGHFWLKLQDKSVKMDEAVSHFGEWLSLPSGSTFELLKDETDELGIRHLRYRQFVDGVEVQASMVLVHGRDGMVTSANGVVMEGTERLASSRRVSATQYNQQKLYLVKTSDGYRYATLQYDFVTNSDAYVDYETGEVLKSLPHRFAADITMKGRSMYSGTVPLSVTQLADGWRIMTDSVRNIYTVNAVDVNDDNSTDYLLGKNEKGEDLYDRERYIRENCPPITTESDFWTMPKLVEVSLDSIAPQDDPFAELYIILHSNNWEEQRSNNMWIDAADTTARAFVSELPKSLRLTAPGGPGAFYNIGSYNIQIWQYQYNGDDICIDTIYMKQMAVGRHDWNTGKTVGHVTIEAAADPAVDVHWGMQQTYDWYKTMFGRESFDGKGSPIYNILYAPRINDFVELGKDNNNNAFANFDSKYNCWVMEYGIGDGLEFRPLVAIDIMAHELTHLVTKSTADLEYEHESGALNESFSDIMGISVKKTVRGSKAAGNWLIGDEVTLQMPCMRDMSHNLVGTEGVLPIYYKGDNWNDEADVHVNSAIQNYWFYLVCKGGEFGDLESPWGGTGLYLFGIGIDKGAQIAYRNLTQYLSPTANFSDARMGSLQAATDLFGEGSSEYETVYEAWHAVGVREDTPSTGIQNTSVGSSIVSNWDWYNLQGQCIVGKPSKTGVYIHHGRKVVIK